MSASTASSVRSSALPPLPLSVNVSASAAGNVVQALSQAALLIALTQAAYAHGVARQLLGELFGASRKRVNRAGRLLDFNGQEDT